MDKLDDLLKEKSNTCLNCFWMKIINYPYIKCRNVRGYLNGYRRKKTYDLERIVFDRKFPLNFNKSSRCLVSDMEDENEMS